MHWGLCNRPWAAQGLQKSGEKWAVWLGNGRRQKAFNTGLPATETLGLEKNKKNCDNSFCRVLPGCQALYSVLGSPALGGLCLSMSQALLSAVTSDYPESELEMRFEHTPSDLRVQTPPCCLLLRISRSSGHLPLPGEESFMEQRLEHDLLPFFLKLICSILIKGGNQSGSLKAEKLSDWLSPAASVHHRGSVS
jgi:hypothetical protein